MVPPLNGNLPVAARIHLPVATAGIALIISGGNEEIELPGK
jgi:hypothetical protein